MNFIKYLLLFLTIFFLKNSFSQSFSKKINIKAGLYFSQGIRGLHSTEQLNAHLTGNNFPGIKKSLTLTEAGIGVWINRWYLLAIQKEFTLAKNKTPDFNSSGNGTGFELDFAYSVVHTEKLKLFPFVGIGTQSQIIHLDPVSVASFDNQLTNPDFKNSIRIKLEDEQIGVIGLGLNYRLTGLFKETCSLQFTGQIDYLFSGGGTWSINDQLVQNPEADFRGLEGKLGLILLFNLMDK